MNVNTVRLAPPFVIYYVAVGFRHRETLEPFIQAVGIAQHGNRVDPPESAINTARAQVESEMGDQSVYEFVNASVAATVFEVPE